MRTAILAAALAIAAAGCDSKGSVATTAPSAPAEKRTDVHIDTPGAKVDVHGRRPDGTGKRDIDVDVKKKDH